MSPPREGEQADRREAAEARRQTARQQMQAGVEALRSSEGWRAWAEVRSRFHHYSTANTLLILAQRPEASLVAGYRRWQQLDRQVRRGEQAIRIWGPEMRMVTDQETGERVRRRVGWLTVPVFDVSQTDGAPLPAPPAPAPLTGDSHAHLWQPLVAAAAETGVSVSLGDAGGADGYFRPATNQIVIEQGLVAPNARVFTLLHELAHAQGADPQVFGRAGAEVIAETAAYVAARAAGLETDSNSVPYVAHWAEADPKFLEQAAGAVDQIASRLERALGLDREQPERDREGSGERGGAARTDQAPPGGSGPGQHVAREQGGPGEPSPAGGEQVRYVAERDRHGLLWVNVHGPGRQVQRLEHLVRHSPTGVEWGYGGSGPADLARSIVGHALGTTDPDPALYQAVKSAVVATAPREGFAVTQAEVLAVVDRARQRSREAPERVR